MLLLIEKVLMNSRILNDMMDLQKIAFTNCYDNAFDSILKSGKGLVVMMYLIEEWYIICIIENGHRILNRLHCFW